MTPICLIKDNGKNKIFVKREDLIPYSFGGNKARKAELFFQEIDKGAYDCVITYGSSHSNHCRVVANMAVAREIPCYIIAPQEVSDETYNSKMMRMFGAEFIVVPVEQVHDAIERKLSELKAMGRHPYFIPGGGHGNIGTQAYVNCYEEIVLYEKANHTHFDYIFFATGTGTTQAGLVCGQMIHGDRRKIVGISIARKNPRGREVVLQSISEYMKEYYPNLHIEDVEDKVEFIDKYIGDGYGKEDAEIKKSIFDAMKKFGIPLDSTYTGKAFLGMCKEMEERNIAGANILFIHTGGTPLFFDDLNM